MTQFVAFLSQILTQRHLHYSARVNKMSDKILLFIISHKRTPGNPYYIFINILETKMTYSTGRSCLQNVVTQEPDF